jgi:hypothetical protein
LSDESEITRFHVGRTSGRVLSEVRRPTVHRLGEVPDRGRVKVDKPAPEPKANPEPKATASKPAKNDGAVKVKDDG